MELIQILEKDTTTCEECGGTLVQTTSDFVCQSCGLVNRKVYVNPNAEMFHDTDKEICHFEKSNRSWIHDDLGSFLDYRNSTHFRNSQGKSLQKEKQCDLIRQKKLNDLHSNEPNKKRLYRALRILSRIVGTLELSGAIKEDSAKLFRLSENKLTGIVFIAEMIGGAIYLSIRTNSNENLRLKKLVEAFTNNGYNVRPNKILEAAALIRKEVKRPLRILRPIDYYETILSKISQDSRVIQTLEKKKMIPEIFFQDIRSSYHLFLKKITLERREGRNTYVLACATFVGADMLLAHTQKNRKSSFIPQNLLANVLDVAEFTLREHFLKIVKPMIPDLLSKLQ
ncbi:MAG: hypothetical protein ACFFBD_20515 [Candidatus Hodarchaeota archaeon]